MSTSKSSSQHQGVAKNPTTDRRHQDNGQGEVKHPETDHRLKQNRDK